jgi:hypothetical protein
MGLSGSRDFIQTRDDIIKSALRKLGVLAQGDTPTTAQVTEGATALNMMVQSWQARGLHLWTVTAATQILTHEAATYTYTDTTVLAVQNPFIRRSSYDYPVDIITQEEYDAISYKTQKGLPNRVLFKRSMSNYTLTLYYTPDNSTDVLHYEKITKLQDFDASTDNPDFPTEWSDALSYGLAYRLAPEYGIPLNERNTLRAEAESFWKIAFEGTSRESGNMMISPYIGNR